MTIQVSKDVENAINAAVQSGRFASADEMIDTLVHEYQERHQHTRPAASQQSAAEAHKRIWEVAAELRKSIRPEEWDKLPKDGARQHDHYIYGTPKRPPA
jgi:Arc/MetJ-type ribon-helix-helix transcriptional regulator